MINLEKHKEQRVGVFVDVQNMYYSAKNLYNAKVNFKALLSDAVSRRKLVRAIAYVIRADIKEESNFFEALRNIGYEVRAKDLQIFFGGAKKGDWDVGLAMDMIRLSPKLDTEVLVSGDGDFRELVEYLKSHGCRVEAIAFRKTASNRLLEVVDDFIDMDKQKRRYLIAGRPLQSKPPVNKPQVVVKTEGAPVPVKPAPKVLVKAAPAKNVLDKPQAKTS